MIREFIYVNLQGDEVAMVEVVDKNGNATQMTKAHYEAQQVEHLTEITPQAALSTPIVNAD